MLNGFLHAAEQKVTYSIVPGNKVVSFNTLNGADDDYVMKFTVSGSWAEIFISPSLDWSGESGQSPMRISDCTDDSAPSSEQYTFNGGDLGSWNMWGDGWHGPTADCGEGGEGTPPSFYVTIEDDREFDVRAVGATSALVGDRLQLHGVVYYPDDIENFVEAESDWDDPPSNTSLYEAASEGNALTGESLKNHINVYAGASQAGEYTFGAVPNAEPDSGKSGSEALKFHSVYLGIEGVEDEDKEDPGGYLGVGAETLQRINLTLDPDHMEATSVTLKVEEGSGIVRIWENANGTGSALISGTESQKTWNHGTPVPASLYVEALSDSTETEVNLELAYADYGENENGLDRVKLNLISVKIVEDSTTKYNFSPSLSEKSKIRVNVSPIPPEGGLQGFHFKLEIVRGTKSGEDQPIDWVNVSDDPGSASAVRSVNFDSELFEWNGKPTVLFGSSAAAAEGPGIFSGVSAGFNRVLPSVSLNKCVPPPIYTVVATIRKSPNGEIIAEDRRNVFVPQVLKIEYDPDGKNAITSELKVVDTGEIIYSQMNEDDWITFKNTVTSLMQASYDAASANIRVVDSGDVELPYSTITVAESGAYIGLYPSDFPNADPEQSGHIFVNSLRALMLIEYGTTLNGQVSASELGHAVGIFAIHEFGHGLGLVQPGDILNGTSWHNKGPWSSRQVMHPGPAISGISAADYMGRNGGWAWKLLNAQYLKFILPKTSGD